MTKDKIKPLTKKAQVRGRLFRTYIDYLKRLPKDPIRDNIINHFEEDLHYSNTTINHLRMFLDADRAVKFLEFEANK